MAVSGKRAANRERMRRYLALRSREGLTFKALATRVGVTAATLLRWQRIFREEEGSEMPDLHQTLDHHGDHPSSFVELLIGRSPQGSSPFQPRSFFEVDLGGVTVQVPPDFDDAALARLIAVLRRSC